MFFGAYVPIGLPTSDEIPVEPQYINEASRAKENQVWKQDFRYGTHYHNRILAYNEKDSNTFRVHYVVDVVADIYHAQGSQTQYLGLPTGDTYSDVEGATELEELSASNQEVLNKRTRGELDANEQNNLNSISSLLNIVTPCDNVYMQHVGYVTNKNGAQIAYDGVLVVNTWNVRNGGQKVFLVKNGIFEKYSSLGLDYGCNVSLGLPNSEETPVEPQDINPSTQADRNQVWKQDFRYGDSFRNRLMAYRFGNSTTLKKHYILGEVANEYYRLGSQTNYLSLPTTDTLNSSYQTLCQQEFEGGQINRCAYLNLISRGVEIQEEGSKWNKEELENMKRVLDTTPQNYYKEDKLIVRKILTGRLGCSKESTKGYYNFFDNPYRVNMCSILPAENNTDLVYQGTFVHELAHLYSRVDANIEDGENYDEYTEILFNYDTNQDKYLPDETIINKEYFLSIVWPGRTRCEKYNDIYTYRPTDRQQIFSSAYACFSSVGEDSKIKDNESMAEDIRIFYLNREALKRLDRYDYNYYFNNYNNNGSSLERYEYIRDNILNN